jgi:hypothetical protein
MDLVKRLKSICLDTVAADTLNAIFQNWAALNPQLTTILNWTSHAPHPCNISNTFNFETLGLKYEGAWSGVGRVIEVGLHLSKWFGVFLKVQQTSFRASCTRLSPPFKSSDPWHIESFINALDSLT